MGATVIVDLTSLWLFACLVARVLMFPGSFKVFQRNTEATFRTEISRQYSHFLRQLGAFLRHAAKQSDIAPHRASADDVVRGIAVIQTLTASFKMQQQQHEVRLSKQQELVQAAAQEVERWLVGASVCKPGAGGDSIVPFPLLDWLKQQATSMSVSQVGALMSVEIAGDREDAMRSIHKLEELLAILDELKSPKKGMFSNALRFLRVPTVGSLNQLRTELQMRFGGQRVWVPTCGGHRLDAMYIPCDSAPSAADDEDDHEAQPLKSGAAERPPCFLPGPTIIMCNPNAAYYETNVYQAGWLSFWLSHGISLFLFNYAGYGCSTGKPSPSRIAQDGKSVIGYLKSRGITQIGVYGRSIGGVAGCHLARHHPDVQLLIADRTMSTLENAARYMYGAWAASGLKLTAMMADNVDTFWEARAYKLLIVDPKDTMILDLAALRTAVAMRVLEKMAPEERFVVGEDMLARIAEIWQFFAVLLAICESDDDFSSADPAETRQARQPTFLRDEQPRTDCRLKGSESGSAQPATGGGLGNERLVGLPWLEHNAMLVRSTMALHCDQLRSALDVVGESLEGGGVTLNDTLAVNPNCACWALRCMLANLQVWGTLGEQGEDGDLGTEMQAADRDVQQFICKAADGAYPMAPRVSWERLAQLGESLSPEMLTTYHRRLARARVGHVRKEFRRRLSALQNALTQPAGCSSTSCGANGSSGGGAGDLQEVENVERLLRTVLHHLTAVESFVSSLSRFFKSVDLAVPYSRQQGHGLETPQGCSNAEATLAPKMRVSKAREEAARSLSDSSDEKMLEVLKGSEAVPQPNIDHATSGYIMHVDCGHNGMLDEVELRQLSLHLRAAGFSRTATDGPN